MSKMAHVSLSSLKLRISSNLSIIYRSIGLMGWAYQAATTGESKNTPEG